MITAGRVTTTPPPLGERVRACAAFRQAMEIDGSRRQTQMALGNLLFDCGQWERALHCFECAAR
jgi:hypothetical protein